MAKPAIVWTFTVAALGAIIACSEPSLPPAQPVLDMRARQLFVAMHADGFEREVFGCNGEWRHETPGEVTTGSYTTNGNELCVTREDGSRSCRSLVGVERNRMLFRHGSQTEPTAYHFAVLSGMPECGPVQLTGDDLRSAVRGRSHRTLYPPEDGPGAIAYGCEGRWAAHGGRVSGFGGTYQVLRDRVCMMSEMSNETSCHAVFRDGAGNLYVGLNPSPASTPLSPIELSGAPERC